MKDELQDDRVVRRGSSGLRDLLKKKLPKIFSKKVAFLDDFMLTNIYKKVNHV